MRILVDLSRSVSHCNYPHSGLGVALLASQIYDTFCAVFLARKVRFLGVVFLIPNKILGCYFIQAILV